MIFYFSLNDQAKVKETGLIHTNYLRTAVLFIFSIYHSEHFIRFVANCLSQNSQRIRHRLLLFLHDSPPLVIPAVGNTINAVPLHFSLIPLLTEHATV